MSKFFMLSRQTHPQPGGVPEPAAHVPALPPPTSPAAHPVSAEAHLFLGCGGRTPASAQSGSSGHVQAVGERGKTVSPMQHS